ncbi:MAG: Secreted protein containing DUF945, bacterial [uncultured Campylobacterales bacterium]|uniref:Secreted protein containing DUF945, bacterial n=1 Tax=uncultured Campylobacterales bacterium TaxID=352960 RepID=A0A6S6SS18_9BACT|nr:MAG: Secreted protein containing DUF945, bacterial [uncultured Campylobacterales bacterium]
MKKILVFIVVVLIGYFGSVAFVGSKSEEHHEKYINQVNKIYQKHGIELKSKLIKKSFFTAKYELSMDYTNENMKKIIAEFYTLPMVFEYDVEFGPLLFRNGFGLGYAGFYSKKSLNSVLAKDLSTGIFKGKETNLVTKGRITFSDKLICDVFMDEININIMGAVNVKVAESSLVSKTDIKTLLGSGTVNIPSVELTDLTNPAKKVTIENIDLHANIKEFIETTLLGDFVLDIEKVSLAGNEFQFQPRVEVGMNENEKGLLDINAKLVYKNLKGQLSPIKVNNANISMALNKLDKSSLLVLSTYFKEVQNKQLALFDKMSNKDANITLIYQEIEALNSEIAGKIMPLIKNVLVLNKTNLKIDANINKENKLDFKADYIADGIPNRIDDFEYELPTVLANSFKAEVSLEVIKSIAGLLRVPSEQLAYYISEGFIEDLGDVYTTKANYEPVKLVVNSRDKTALVSPFVIIE